MSQQLQAIQQSRDQPDLHQLHWYSQHHPSHAPYSALISDFSSNISSVSPTVSHTATIVTSSVPSSVAGHMMYPGAHVMYATSTPTLADGGLTVLNTFPQAPAAMHVSHTQAQDSGQSHCVN
ncbi:hypothetical protein M9458_043165, partial [Cirrhinus mrigala]